MDKFTSIKDIVLIKNNEDFIEKNQDKIFLYNCLGNRDFDNQEDDIGQQIKLLQIKYKFNINEVFIFRTNELNKIIIYSLYENKIYMITTNEKIISSHFFIVDYLVLIFENDKYNIIDIKNMHSWVFMGEQNQKDNNILDKIKGITQLCIKLKSDKITEPIIHKIEDENMLEELESLNYVKKNMFYNVSNKKIQMSNIWSNFILDTKNCICYSDNNGFIKYYIYIKQEELFFNNLSEFIHFLFKEFYTLINTIILFKD